MSPFFVLLFIKSCYLMFAKFLSSAIRLQTATVSSDHGSQPHIFVSLIWSVSMMYDWASLDHVIVCDKLPVSWSPGVTGPIVPASPLVSPGVGSPPSPDVRNAPHPPCWPHTDLTQLSPNSIHLPTSQIRWQLSVCVNLRVIRTMKIFLSHNQHWDPITEFTTGIILSLLGDFFHIFLVFPNYPLRCNKMKLTV